MGLEWGGGAELKRQMWHSGLIERLSASLQRQQHSSSMALFPQNQISNP